MRFKRVLVTGGAGFVGRALVERLLDRGHAVTVIDNLSSATPLPLPDGVQFVEADVIDPPSDLDRHDLIYHLASPASPPRYGKDPVGTLRTGAEGTRQMLDRAADWGARFLFASTSEIYGDPLEHPQDEGYRGNVSVTSPRACYDEAKRYAEALVYAYQRSGLVSDVRVARIFNTYGPGMHPDDGRVVSSFIVAALTGRPLEINGDGTQTRAFCFVSDLVAGLMLLAESSHTGPVNLGKPDEITILELADRIAELVGDTGRAMRPMPDGDPVRRCPDISLAARVLGWQPTVGLADGLERTVAYFRDLVPG